MDLGVPISNNRSLSCGLWCNAVSSSFHCTSVKRSIYLLKWTINVNGPYEKFSCMLVNTKLKNTFLECIIIKFACQLRYMLEVFVASWITFHITVGSGFIKLFTYVIQSSSIKMLGLLLWNIYHLKIPYWRFFFFDYLAFSQRGVIIVSLRKRAVTGALSHTKHEAARNLESVFSCSFNIPYFIA